MGKELKGRFTINTLAFHFLCFLINVSGCYYDLNYGFIPQFSRYGGRARFLTHLTEFFTTFYTGFALLTDLYNLLRGARKFKSKSLATRDFIFATVVFPTCVIVTLLFWGIAAVDLDGILPPENRKLMPLFGLFNQFLHTWPIIFSVANSALVYHEYPPRGKGLCMVNVVGIGYIVWLFYIKAIDGEWVYPFLNNLPIIAFIVFILGSLATAALVYLVGEKVTDYCWSPKTKHN